MILGGPIFREYSSPDSWASAVKATGYGAVYCPVDLGADDSEIQAYAQAAKRENIVIAEVGAWSNNPVSPDEEIRNKSLENLKEKLILADKIGARCCVNVSGSRGARWAGHHPDNLTEETFDMIVEYVREVIDAVKPSRTFFALETMPWMYPDSPESYLQLVKAIDRKKFGVHFDPVNIVCSPQRYFNNGALIRECFEKLGAYIKSCHAKDILLADELTVHMDEVRPGTGYLDYRTYLKELNKIASDTPLMIEHLPNEKEYIEAAKFIRKIASEEGIDL